jgi:glutamate dehydrogenase
MVMDEFSAVKGYNSIGVAIGKPVNIGGSMGRVAAAARGCSFVIR